MKETQQVSQVASPYTPRAADIVEVEQFTETEKLFRFVLQDGSRLAHQPGQFAEVSLFGYGEAPISICSSPTRKDSFEMCIRNVGSVTNALHQLKAGDTVGIRGPFGKGFDVETAKGKDVLFVAGGLGLAPARSFINYVMDTRSDFRNATILYGARSPKDLLFWKEVQTWTKRPDVNCLVTVDRKDESWTGHVGVITTLFKNIKIDARETIAVIVGPPVMFKFAVIEALGAGILENRIYCSLERRMKCGLGKCGHCQIGKTYVCQDGPVFTYSQIKRMREGI